MATVMAIRRVIDELPQGVIETIVDTQDAKSLTRFMMSSKYVYDTVGDKLRAKIIDEWANNLSHTLRYVRSAYRHVARGKEKATLAILKSVLSDSMIDGEQGEPPQLIFMSQVNHITKYIISHIEHMSIVDAIEHLCNINARGSLEWGHEEENQVWYWFQKYFFGDVLLWDLEWETTDLEYKFLIDFEQGTLQFNVLSLAHGSKSQVRSKKCLVNSGTWQRFHNQGVRPIDNEHLEISIINDAAMKSACVIIAEMVYDTFGGNQLMATRVGKFDVSACPYMRGSDMQGGGAFYYNSVYLQKEIETSIAWCTTRLSTKH
jgi:hypothetical protein